jgi:hypothetical protein
MFSGEIYFNYVVTLGRDLPYLPIEVRKKILDQILYKMSCLTCNEVIISFKPVVISHSDGYSIVNGLITCKECKKENLIN